MEKKMKVKFASVLLLSIFGAVAANAAPYVQDTGKIKNLYVSAGGNVAIQLDNGFPNSANGGQCSTANISSFGGNVTADPVFKSALLAAKAAQQSITVTVQGCEASGAWFKIIDVYVN
jgi:hypothetical protein